MPVCSARVARAVNRKWRPSGRKCGQRCEFSPRAASSAVTGSGAPPPAATRCNGGAIGRRKDDRSVAVPRRARDGRGGRRDDLDGAAVGIDALQIGGGRQSRARARPGTKTRAGRPRFPGYVGGPGESSERSHTSGSLRRCSWRRIASRSPAGDGTGVPTKTCSGGASTVKRNRRRGRCGAQIHERSRCRERRRRRRRRARLHAVRLRVVGIGRLGARFAVEIQARVADISQAPLRILLETALEQPANGGRCRGPQRGEIDVAFDDLRDDVGECGRPRTRVVPDSISYSTQPNAQMSVRLSTGSPRACSGLMYAGVPAIMPGLAERRDRAAHASSAWLRARSNAFARPKSSTLTVPSALSAMLDGFRSRWMTPCSCAASRAAAICRAISSASGIGRPPRRPASAVGERVAFHELEHECQRSGGLLDAVERGDVRMIQRRQDLRFALEARATLAYPPRSPRAAP